MFITLARTLCVLIALTMASTSQAAIMTATYAGTGDGNLGGVGFSGASFVITATYDTADVFNPSVLQVEHQSVSIAISGFSPATFTTATRTFFFDGDDVDVVGISHIASEGGFDLFDIANSGLDGWNMTTSIGPVFDPAPFAIEQFNGVQTTGGELNFSSINDATFTARGDGVIPEPGTLAAWALLLALPLGRASRPGPHPGYDFSPRA